MQDRRGLIKFAGVAAAASLAGVRNIVGQPSAAVSLFDGKTLDGWIQVENSTTAFSTNSIIEPAGFVTWITDGNDTISTMLRARFSNTLKTDLAKYSPASESSRIVLSTLVKEINQIVSGPSIYEKERFSGVVLRPETAQLLRQKLTPYSTAQLNKMLLEDAYPSELAKSSAIGWVVKDGVMASTGAGRGVIYTAKDYSRFRLRFSIRHISGNPDHQAGILIFCTHPQPGEKPLDALAGIQFQVPLGGRWDYRPGKNNNGGSLFTLITRPTYNIHEWSDVEILADAETGVARMAVAQPPGTKAVEVLQFKDPTAGKVGPIAWQMHNAGLFDEYKNVTIEVDPKDHTLITVR